MMKSTARIAELNLGMLEAVSNVPTSVGASAVNPLENERRKNMSRKIKRPSLFRRGTNVHRRYHFASKSVSERMYSTRNGEQSATRYPSPSYLTVSKRHVL